MPVFLNTMCLQLSNETLLEPSPRHRPVSGLRRDNAPTPVRRRRERFAALALCLALPLLSSAAYGLENDLTSGSPAVSGVEHARENLVGQIPQIVPNGQRVLLLMIDGLAVRPFEAALEAGSLPNLARLMRTRPGIMTQAISTFPSATAPAVPELVSGRFAEIENLPAPGAVHAFDRERRQVIRYVTNPDSWQWPVVTLFDATRHLPAITVFEGRWDGPKSVLTQFNMAKQAVFEILGAGGLSDGDRGPVEQFLQAVRSSEPPSVSLVVLNGFDLAAHFYGPESEQARDALVASDRLVGEIMDTLASTRGTRQASLLDETNIILFGDHGLVASGQFVDLVSVFRDLGMNAVDVSTIPHVLFRERTGTLWTAWTDVILVSGGSNITQVYLRHPSGSWRRQQAQDGNGTAGGAGRHLTPATLAAALVHTPGIDQILWQGDAGETHILSANNRAARILSRNNAAARRFAYVVPRRATQDPLDYLDDPELHSLVCRDGVIDDGCYRSRTEWFDATFDSRYPGAVPIIPKVFHPERFTGDLIITLKPGYSFMRDQQGDHGNLHRDAVLTPLILNGPGIRPCDEPHRPRLVDLYPTVAVLLGARPDDPAFTTLDGRVLDCVILLE